jgi:hypothetical protein
MCRIQQNCYAYNVQNKTAHLVQRYGSRHSRIADTIETAVTAADWVTTVATEYEAETQV